MEKSNGQVPNSLKTSNMSLNADDSYTGSVTLEQMRHEKKKTKNFRQTKKQSEWRVRRVNDETTEENR